MKKTYKKILKNSIISTIGVLVLLSSPALADCTYELFNINSAKGTKIVDFIDQLSNECEFSLVISDPQAEKVLNLPLNITHIKNLTINEVLDLILKQYNLSYSLQDNILKISYLTTKVYNIDYILSQRKGIASTDVTLSSQSAGTSGGAMGSSLGNNAMGGVSSSSSSMMGMQSQATNIKGSASTSKSGMKIESTDEVQFWESLDNELRQVLNRPEDRYVAEDPIINKNAGLITVTATQGQLDRLDTYLKRLQDKVKLQVLIDVQLLVVTMTKGHNVGVDWTQLYKLQNVAANVSYSTNHTTGGDAVTLTGAGINLDQVVEFLKTQGSVSSLSNPKVLTLNNQPALVTAGTEYFYTIKQTTTLPGSAGGISAQTENDIVNSVFAGVLLDITPEISDNDMITLKVNPSLSETTTDLSQSTSATRTSPPDLNRKQLSSVVTVKDGNRIILGGLITSNKTLIKSKVPLLGDIPGLSYLFSSENYQKQVQELVIVMEPHIIRNKSSDISLSSLGYEGIDDSILKHDIKEYSTDTEEKNTTKDLIVQPEQQTTKKAEIQDEK